MVLRLEEHWVWDSWVADDGERYHLFFLQAPRSLGDLTLRHQHAGVGHATSHDLVQWEYAGVCFAPSVDGFDDRAIWTGSVLRAWDRWWMFYSALSRSGHAFAQRIGVAVSDDLHDWRRVGHGPVAHVDPTWYRTIAGEEVSETWRDPFVVPDPEGDGWHMLITGRAREPAAGDDGVVAHARSRDLLSWTVGPPRSRPRSGFGQLEVIRSVVIDGRAVLVFTCHPSEMTPRRAEAGGHCCTWSVPAPSVVGPWDVAAARPFTTDPDLFAAPLVQRRDGSWVIFGFRNLEHRGEDGLFIHDPIPVTLDGEGYLTAGGPTEARATTSHGR